MRTALHGLIAGGFGYGDAVGLYTRPGKTIYFLDVLHASGRVVVTPRGTWSSPQAIGYGPLEILLATNTLRRRLGQDDLDPEVFGDLLEEAVEAAMARGWGPPLWPQLQGAGQAAAHVQ
ncbi:MAG: hypothetical protein VKM98_09410 [Cyanobacteriota bacterium]|nr:hypothetical protein [Cyanobacteriota bacterium]